MIKAVMVLKNGGRGVLLGITDRNIEKMRAGEPIRVDVGALDPALANLVIYVITGTDEGAITRQLYAEGVIHDELALVMRPGQPMQPGEAREWRRPRDG